jgi:hypothetical protein
MKQSPTGSFLKFTIGFLVFISLSFGVTFAVNEYTMKQARIAAEAAAQAALIGH